MASLIDWRVIVIGVPLAWVASWGVGRWVRGRAVPGVVRAPAVSVLGLLTSGLVAVMAVPGALAGRQDVMLTGGMVVVGVLVLFWLWDALVARLVVSDEGIEQVTGLLVRRRLAWADVAGVHTGKSYVQIVPVAGRGRPMRVGQGSQNLEWLSAECERRGVKVTC